MRFEKIEDTVICHLDSERHFFVSPKDLGVIAALDFSKIRIHNRKNVSQVIYIDEENRHLKLNRFIAGCSGNSYLTVTPANDNPLDLRAENLMIEKLGSHHNTKEFNLKKKRVANLLPPLPIVRKENLAIAKEKKKSPEPTPNPSLPKSGKLSINPLTDDINLVVNDFECVLTKDNPYQNAKILTALLNDHLGVKIE